MQLAPRPDAFKKRMELIFAGETYEIALVDLDDVIVSEEILKELWNGLNGFQHLAEIGVIVKGSKFNSIQKFVSILGPIISEIGVKVDPEKLRA